MIIEFIGAGNVAQAIVLCALAQGRKVIIGSRSADRVDRRKPFQRRRRLEARAGTLADAASAEMVVLAVPWPEAEKALAHAPAWTRTS